MLTDKILYKIFSNVFRKESSIKKAGVTGSYSRQIDFTNKSDIDIVLELEGNELNDEGLEECLLIKDILYEQFNRKTDFIYYHVVLKGKDDMRKEEWEQKGYEVMLDNLKWIWKGEEYNELYFR